MKTLLKTVLAVGCLGAVSLVATDDARAQASSTVGSLRGLVRDKATGEAAIGATVIAQSPSLQGTQVAIVEAGGEYFVTALPPGVYTLTIIYEGSTFSRRNVLIQVGKEAVVNVTVDPSAAASKPKGETIEIQGTAPIIDQGSTKVGVTITDDYTRNIPTGRTFGGVLGGAAGSQDDFFGTSIAGATSVENTYIVDGINTTDTGFGLQSSDLPNEFVEETEVITGGYNAEYGRATGGIINVVTKHGSNEVHGSVWGYLTPGALISSAKVIQTEGGSIDSKSDLDYAADLGGEVGGPIIKDKLWFHVGLNPHVSSTTTTRLIQQQIDENQDGQPDLGSDGYTIHKKVSSSSIPQSSKTYYFTGKINGAINPNHQFQLSTSGSPQVADEQFSTAFEHSPQSQLFHRSEGAYDVAAKWTSKLDDGKTEIDAVAGFHRGYDHQSAPGALSSQNLVFYGYERSLYDFADLEGPINGCSDGAGDLYTKIRNCPVSNYAESGLGLLEDRTNDRISAVVSATRRVKLLGHHTFKAGVDLEVSTYNSRQFHTGGADLERFCNSDPATGECSDDPSALPGPWQSNSFSKIIRNLTPEQQADPMSVTLAPGEELCSGNRAVCANASALVANTTDRSIGGYVQDSWQIVPFFTINAGLRYEQQIAYVAKQLEGTVAPTGEIVQAKGFTLNNWAPRLGFILDPSQEGKAKLFGHWGRFYENVPMDLSVRGFGGEIDKIGTINTNQYAPGSTNYDPNCNVDHAAGSSPATRLGQCSDAATQTLLGGGSEYVTPGLRGQYTEELVVGTEYEIAPDVTVGMDYLHRTLPSVIEDILTPDGEYFITNPGQDLSKEAAALDTQAAKLMASTDPAKQALGKVMTYRADQVRRLGEFDAPSRTYDALQLSVKQRPTSRSLLLASYTYSKERGNYPGLFSTETQQLNPNGSSQYDLPSLLANRYGLLGLDRTHNLKIDGFYQFDLKKLGSVVVGLSVRAESGIPHNALGTDPVYGQGEAYLLPRGSFTRSPVTGGADLHFSYGRRLGKNSVEGFVNVFNVLDLQDEISTDEYYTLDPVLPIVGGDKKDLAHMKTLDLQGVEHNATPNVNPNFQKANGLQAPRSIQLGFRVTF